MILGPTATGKSDLAVYLAKKFNGEVISADSRQVYKNLNLGTGKITKKEMEGIPHHLLDIASPKSKVGAFSVSKWKEKADKAIEKIISKNKLPIICGGTGLYIQSIVDNLVLPEVPPNFELRKKMEKKSTSKLFGMLEKLDSERASNIDKNNRVRLVRAIEIAKNLGKVPALVSKGTFDILQIGLDIPDEVLKERINNRLISRIKSGMIREAKKLHQEGLTWKRMYDLGLEYRYLSMYLQNKISRDEMTSKLETEIWHYAKRQRTWFKRDKSIKWYNPTRKIDLKKIETECKKFLKN